MTFDFHRAQRRARRRTLAFRLVFAAMLAGVVAGYGVVLHLAAASVEWGAVPRGWAVGAVWAAGGLVAALAVRELLAERAVLLSGTRVARMLRAREVTARAESAAERTLRNVTEEVAVAAGVPAPRVYVLPKQPGINALAVGPDVAHGSVFVSSSAAEELSRDALQAVVAHEVAHLASGDAALHALSGGASAALRLSVAPMLAVARVPMALVRDPAAPAGQGGVVDPRLLLLALLFTPFPAIFAWMVATGVAGALGALAVLAVGLPAVGLLGWLFAELIDLAVSQQTEYAADALAVELTRHPEALAEALRAVRDTPLQGLLVSPAVPRLQPFFFARPVLKPAFMDGLFESHPPPQRRLAELRSPDRVRGTPSGAPERWRAAPQPRSLDAPPPAPSRPTDPLAAAAALLDALPAPVTAAAHDLALVEPLAYALLLDADAGLRLRQRNVLPADLADRTLALWQTLDALPRAARLPVAEIALPAMRRLGAPRRERLLATADALVRADGRLSVAELALGEAFRRGLRAAPRRRAVSPEGVLRAAATVLATLARAGATAPSARAAAYAAGTVELGRHLYGELRAFGPAGLDAFRDALDTLATADPASQDAVLDAALATVRHDRRTTDGEADLVRLLALALGRPCPLPPPAVPLAPSSPRGRIATAA